MNSVERYFEKYVISRGYRPCIKRIFEDEYGWNRYMVSIASQDGYYTNQTSFTDGAISNKEDMEDIITTLVDALIDDLSNKRQKTKGMNTIIYSRVHDCFETYARSLGYECDVRCKYISYLHNITSYTVRFTDPLSRVYAEYSFNDKYYDKFISQFHDFAKMVVERLINQIRKENEKMEIGYLPINSRCVCYGDVDLLTIKDVIFNPPATIVFWTDGTKTVVKTQNGEEFDPEKGLAMAYFKKMHGNKGHYFEEIKKWTEKYEDQNTVNYTDDDLEAMCSEFEKNLTKLNTTVLNYVAAKNDSTPGDNKCQST